jgi:cellulose synthase/poly-beta-1,6-N-acetylglucosamine synthase-like glycosyltransferase
VTTENISIFVFWFFTSIVWFIYCGYPITLLLLTFLSKKNVVKKSILPEISIIIPVYNESKNIAKTIENKLNLNYPQDKLSIFVISDASTDKTNDIVRKYQSKGVKLLTLSQRKGKTAAINLVMPKIKSGIVIFSDGNSLYDKNAVSKLVSNFADPTVGYVSGKMLYGNPKQNSMGEGCSTYMKYENFIRILESKCGSIVGVDGGIDAFRSQLYFEMPNDALPDFVLPLKVIEQGYRVIFEPKAILHEESLPDIQDEYRMRVRVSLRAFAALYMMKSLFNPFKYGLFSFQLFCHKLLRYLAGFFLFFIFLSNIFIASSHAFYIVTLILQIIIYLLGTIGYLLKEKNTTAYTYIPFYFMLLNTSSLVAFLQFCAGKKKTIWEPRKG